MVGSSSEKKKELGCVHEVTREMTGKLHANEMWDLDFLNLPPKILFLYSNNVPVLPRKSRHDSFLLDCQDSALVCCSPIAHDSPTGLNRRCRDRQQMKRDQDRNTP